MTFTQSIGLLWTRNRPVAETSTWQNTPFTRDMHSCPRWDSNPQSQQVSDYRPTPETARPPVSAWALTHGLCCVSLLHGKSAIWKIVLIVSSCRSISFKLSRVLLLTMDSLLYLKHAERPERSPYLTATSPAYQCLPSHLCKLGHNNGLPWQRGPLPSSIKQ